MVDAQISRCIAALSDLDRLREEVGELKALAHPRATFAAALFELDRARKGDPDARAAMLDTADSLLSFWKDKSGPELASSHPELELLWSQAAKLLESFEYKRFVRQLNACWEVREDKDALSRAVADLGDAADERRAEFARCLYHLQLARMSVDGARVEFARRAALLYEAYQDTRVADELVGGDTGLAHLWNDLLPYLDEFFETLEDARAKAAAAAAKAAAEQESPDITQETVDPEVTAPPAATPGDSPSGGERGSPSGGERGSPSGGERGDGRLPLPVATPYVSNSGEESPTQATLPPGTKFPMPRDTAPPPRTTEPQGGFTDQNPIEPPMPPLEPATSSSERVVAAPPEVADTSHLKDAGRPPPPPAPSWGSGDNWAGLSTLRRPSAPEPPQVPEGARETAPPPAASEPFDRSKTVQIPPSEQPYDPNQTVQVEAVDEERFKETPPRLSTSPTRPVGPVTGFDANKTAPGIEALPPLPESSITAQMELPDADVVDDPQALSVTLPPDPSIPPRRPPLPPRPPPPPTETLPPGITAAQLMGAKESETLDPDLLADAEPEPPPPPSDDAVPKLPRPDNKASQPLEVVEDDEPEPGPLTQAFWRGTEVALGLLPPADAPRLNSRVFAADDRKERKKLTTYLEDVKTRYTESEVPEARAMQCLIKLYMAAHLKEKTLFGQKNEKRAESFREALSMLGRDPMAAAHCAVWFEMDGPRTLEKLHDGLEVLADYLQYCARNNLDPLAPTSPALFLS